MGRKLRSALALSDLRVLMTAPYALAFVWMCRKHPVLAGFTTIFFDFRCRSEFFQLLREELPKLLKKQR